ncbi:ethylene-responsive transcription factor [Tripterygium wilfordii]|uniref:Ethylene-responsive transcription factor n=1 Tax=Tripterygium wilfordii TaxID=458696 RepID=A0A7J7CFC8_TRIWF|nr:ethylene-responsive transcription factor [Tripterygium wilfordii]
MPKQTSSPPPPPPPPRPPQHPPLLRIPMKAGEQIREAIRIVKTLRVAITRITGRRRRAILPRPVTTSPKDIQAAAAKAAAAAPGRSSENETEAEPSPHNTSASSDNSQESPSVDCDDALFDLPDLFVDGCDRGDGLCYYSPSWQLCGADYGLRSEEPFLLEY